MGTEISLSQSVYSFKKNALSALDFLALFSQGKNTVRIRSSCYQRMLSARKICNISIQGENSMQGEQATE